MYGTRVHLQHGIRSNDEGFTLERLGDEAGARAGEALHPTAGADDALVRIQAAGINPLDRIARTR